MNNKKAVINQVFVYIMSTIAILFVGFLVTKFIVAFQSDSKAIIEEKFFSGLEYDIKQVASRYASEEILDYRLNSDMKNICFVPNQACSAALVLANELPIEEYEIELLAENSNLFIFSKDGIAVDKILNEFQSDDNCFCIQPKSTRFTLLIENRKNKVWISDYSNIN